MGRERRLFCAFSVVLNFFLFFSIDVIRAQDRSPGGDYLPKVGQADKDVVWVPPAQILVEKMLDVAHVTANDNVIDLGSGDGRTVIAAAKPGGAR